MARTPFAELAEAFLRLEATTSGQKMIDILADLFTRLSPGEARMAAYLLRGRVAPDFQPIEFGVAEKLAMRAIAQATSEPAAKIQKALRKAGDLGDVAAALIGKRPRGRGLTLADVFERLKEIALASGPGAQESKIRLLADLLQRFQPREAQYIVRIVLGKLRLGIGEMTFLYGLSKALTGTKEHKPVLAHAYNVLSDLGEVAERAMRYGIGALESVRPKLGKPVRMMLAQRVRDLSEVPKHIPGLWHVEYKYDGERVQAHFGKQGSIALYSRRLDDITHQFPDVAAAVRAAFRGKAAMVEGEVVAVDRESGKLLDFQTLMRRRRKREVEGYVKKIPVQYFVFDLLYLNGRSYLEKPLLKRKEALARNVKAEDCVVVARYVETQDLEEVESFFAEAIQRGTEGVLIKDPQSVYEAGARGWHWIKFKKEYQTDLADTFDVVVVCGLYGKGRRAGTYGSLLVAAFDPATNKYYSFTKVGSGFTNDELKLLPKRLRPYERRNRHPLVDARIQPDIWFDPALVMEVTGAQLTVSPVHTVAKNLLKNGGLALRFPRFLRWRPDKSPEQATTVEEIYDLYGRAKRRVS